MKPTIMILGSGHLANPGANVLVDSVITYTLVLSREL